MKKKKKVIAVVIVLTLLLAPWPIPMSIKDGGSRSFFALFYQIVVWNPRIEVDPDYPNKEYKTGTEIWFLHNPDWSIYFPKR